MHASVCVVVVDVFFEVEQLYQPVGAVLLLHTPSIPVVTVTS